MTVDKEIGEQATRKSAPHPSRPSAAAPSHTPTPWRAELNEKSGTIAILGKRLDGNINGFGDGLIAEVDASLRNDSYFPALNPEDKANAAFIVRAVNSHQALVDALEAAEPIIASDYERGAAQFQPIAPDAALRMIRAALNLAKGT